jgi:hypothetical protein
MHETITYEPDMYLTNKDVKDIQEIFQTPLIGTYNWDYTAADDRINRLYQLAKKRQWNVEIDLDWSQPWNQEDLTLEDYAYNHQMFNDYKPYIKLSDEKKLEFQNKAAAWALAQFLHGEQGALLVSSQLCSCAPTYNSKLYAATQAYDEARHVEAFNKYIQTRPRLMYPIDKYLKYLLDKILTDERWDLKFIGMQLIIEGLALGAFKTFPQVHPDPLAHSIVEYIIKDEARHVTFGVNYLEEHIKNLSQHEIEERAEFAYEACVVMKNRFHAIQVFEEFGWDVEETCAYARNVPIREQFQQFIFQGVIPNLKKVGLLTETVRPKFEELDLLKWEDFPNSEDMEWIEEA